MIQTDLIIEILKETLKKGGEYADIFAEDSQSTLIVLEDNKLEKVTTGIDKGVGIHLIFNNRSSYAYTNDLSSSNLFDMSSLVNKAVNERSCMKTNGLDCRIKASPIDFNVLRYPDTVKMEEKVKMVSEANKRARGIDKRIRQVKVVYSDHVQDITIGNSDGYVTNDKRVYTMGFVQVIAADDNIIQTGYEPIGGNIGFEIFDKKPLCEIAEKAARRALLMLSARSAPAGRMPVVLSSEAGGTMIHEAVGHGLEGDFIYEGISVYSKKIGEDVASHLVTVIDDATIPNRRGSFRFDDEGTESQKTVLIENGILKRFMYDRLSAMKSETTSTGNGRRQSYKHRPIPRMSNTLIASGSHNPEEVVRSLENGLFVKKMGGGQVNTVNGDFVFEIEEGYIVQKGEIGYPVKGATLTGNGPEVLKNITMVGNDLGFALGTCGKDGQGVPVSDAQPTIRIESMVVGGVVTS